MRQGVFAVKKIFQIDNNSFGIEWNDGLIKRYFLKDLQKACPCAGCETSKINKPFLKEDLDLPIRASEIRNVGRYALKIVFTTGCSKGIFTFEQLRGDF